MTAKPHPDRREAEAIAFIDLEAQQRALGGRIEARIAGVLRHGRYIMGPEVAALEAELARYCGVRHAITCSSGTDAMWLALLAWGVGPGDAVFVPALSFTATAEVVALSGATPVFVDVDPHSFNLDPASLQAALEEVTGRGALAPRAVIPVDLYGQPADYRKIDALARAHGLAVLADAAHSFGARLEARRVGTLADATATSFFPSKPLGCYGDGGAVFLDDDETAATIRSLRVHGRGEKGKYDTVRVGTNSRLDTIQAAVLLAKLEVFDDELEARQEIASRYAQGLEDCLAVPVVRGDAVSAWAHYTLVTDRRDALQAGLAERGVPSMIYYPRPLHLQAPYRDCPRAPGGLPVAERLCGRVLSLPMHPYLDEATQERIVAAVRAVAGSGLAGDGGLG